MAEDLSTNIENYKLQLQQVEAALTTSPEDEELLKLKQDLQEVIELTQELLRSQLAENASKASKVAESSQSEENEDLDALFKSYMNNDDGEDEGSNTHKRPEDWRIGDRCLALWIQDGLYYEGTIEAIEGEEVSVLFDNDKKNAVVTTLNMIKQIAPSEKSHFKKPAMSAKMREYQKKKKQKKLQRFKQLEEERESEKKKWINFHNKTSKKGISKKSIFASPDTVAGRVGIGTCGVSGRGMTEYHAADKHKKKAKK
ncbi:hypothetical protein M8J77_008638 [Diaphorina citri]|nr:hypothetical protein M8J77_008638 [Diaphorina citri]